MASVGNSHHVQDSVSNFSIVKHNRARGTKNKQKEEYGVKNKIPWYTDIGIPHLQNAIQQPNSREKELNLQHRKKLQKKGKHPPHLKGKDIGLWYASQNQGQRNGLANEKLKTPVIHIPIDELDKIRHYLTGASSLWNVKKHLDWKSKYESINDSPFKEKFLDNLAANDTTHFGSTSITIGTNFLADISEVNEKLKHQRAEKSLCDSFQKALEMRSNLPIWNHKEALLQFLNDNQAIVVCGETGCGKTTQVAQFLLDDAIENGKGSSFRAICTQPRRIAAISVAERVAEERGEPCGGHESSVGYHIRLEKRLPRQRGSILYCTTGILVQYLQSDPNLENVSHLLLDEVHERDVLIDFLLTIVKDILPKRPKLRVILMSATIDSDVFSKYFNDCPVMNIPGFTYPVETFYLEDVLTMTGFRVRPKFPKRLRGRPDALDLNKDIEYTKLMVPFIEEMEKNRSYPFHVMKSLRMNESEDFPEELVIELLRLICSQPKNGAILIFLPGWEQISKLHRLLLNDRIFSSKKFLILPLHSMMPTVNQRAIFERPTSGAKKIVLSTNIAETSITIDDIVYVIDCGKIKQSGFDSKRNLNTLNVEWISLANGRQRQGRAGRTQPGVCYKLYSRGRESTFDAHPLPEIKRMRLEELILRVKILKLGKIENFLRQLPDPPDEKTVRISIDLLKSLGALDHAECLTPLGYHLAKLPTDPRTGKLILLAAIFGCLEPVVCIAAVLNFKDPFVIPLNSEEAVRKVKRELAVGLRSDHLLIAKVMREYRQLFNHDRTKAKIYCQKNFLSSSTMGMLSDMIDQLCRDLNEHHFLPSCDLSDPSMNVNSSNHGLIRAVLCAGLFPNIAKVSTRCGNHTKGLQRGPQPKITTVEDGKVTIHPKSVNADNPEFQSLWLCYHNKVKTTCIFLHDCSEVSDTALMFFAENLRRRVKREDVAIEVARGIEFLCDRATAEMLDQLRASWESYLAYRVSHPGATNWAPDSSDFALLKAIIQFVTWEGKGNINASRDERNFLQLDKSCYDLISPERLALRRHRQNVESPEVYGELDEEESASQHWESSSEANESEES